MLGQHCMTVFWLAMPLALTQYYLLVYALINFVGTIAILKYFRYRAIGDTSPTPRGTPTASGKLNDRGAKS